MEDIYMFPGLIYQPLEGYFFDEREEGGDHF